MVPSILLVTVYLWEVKAGPLAVPHSITSNQELKTRKHGRSHGGFSFLYRLMLS